MLARYDRSGFVEGAHFGHAVVVDASGEVVRVWGDPSVEIMARSSAKPMQATAMVRSGLELPDELLALAASSHSGEDRHLDGVRGILAAVDLDETALQTPADFPLDPVVRDDWLRAGRDASPTAMNCSGKHAAMLATCVINEWPIDAYLDPAHPLQQEILADVRRLTGDPIVEVGVDGCGAPVHVMTLAGLARSASSAVLADLPAPERRVVDAMRAHPLMVGGENRDVTTFIDAVPGLVAKDGAEGVYVAALPDGTGIALKVLDGSARARQVAFAEILQWLAPDRADGDALAALASIDVLGGGRPVGAVTSPLSTLA